VAVIQRSLETSSRAATATAVRHLFAMAEISRLKRNADVEVRVVSIPGDWVPPVPGVFKKDDHRVFVWVISGHFRGQAACT
jgi:hypothetical protein